MARTNPSNFGNDRHALYYGWVVQQAKNTLGDSVQVVTDDDCNYTPYIDIHFTPADVTLRLMVPAPPAGWDPFGSAPATTTPDTKGKGGGAIAAVIPPVES
jgi:hypothetical protein